ncbi:hypothetical protein VR44_12330 [Streptomyces katrae]|uniref:Uncharacterized protein n=1 Tax=Streptomyces katrae TaxID=68223 RepID=A0A0F4JKE2_9ACTN|nr:hypothetical protein VR44_12330 [Streptomyces katrae]
MRFGERPAELGGGPAAQRTAAPDPALGGQHRQDAAGQARSGLVRLPRRHDELLAQPGLGRGELGGGGLAPPREQGEDGLLGVREPARVVAELLAQHLEEVAAFPGRDGTGGGGVDHGGQGARHDEHGAAHAQHPHQGVVGVEGPLHLGHRRGDQAGGQAEVDAGRVRGVQGDQRVDDLLGRLGPGARGEPVAGGEQPAAVLVGDLRPGRIHVRCRVAGSRPPWAVPSDRSGQDRVGDTR